MDTPRVQYAWNGDTAIAYSVSGDGPIDLVYVQGYLSNVELIWDCPPAARFLERLGSFARLILVDRRGVGLSDRFGGDRVPPLETAADDLRSIMGDVNCSSAVVFGHHEGGQIAALLAATSPELVRSLILYTTPIATRALYGQQAGDGSAAAVEAEIAEFTRAWGTPSAARAIFEQLAPSYMGDIEVYRSLTRMERQSASPGSVAGFYRQLFDTDITGILPSIHVPTLVLHRDGDVTTPVDSGKRIGAAIPDAKFVELHGNDWWPFLGDADALLAEVQGFVLGRQPQLEQRRSLATVLFTDIVGSTERAAAAGDAAWKVTLTEHDRIAKERIEAHGGAWIKSTGDGVLATFDGPARAVLCARAMGEALGELGLEIRAGCHTGEIEHEGKDVLGLSVHIGARVAAVAGPSEIVVSQTVKDLVAGSGLIFEDIGEHELKGVPDRWRLYRAVGS